jgi:hypothetical protein
MMLRYYRRSTLLLTAVATLTGFAACTATATPNGPGRTTAAPTAAPAALPAGVTAATAVPTAVPNATADRKNVTVTACAPTSNGWSASGTAANPGSRSVTYTITVFFTASAGTVIGTGQTRVAVQPHKQAPWTITSTFHAPQDTRCVLRGVG